MSDIEDTLNMSIAAKLLGMCIDTLREAELEAGVEIRRSVTIVVRSDDGVADGVASTYAPRALIEVLGDVTVRLASGYMEDAADG